MKTLFRSLFPVVLVCFLLPAAHASVDTLTILHLNDSHSNLSSIGPRTAGLEGTQGGIARAASLVGLQRATNPNPLFLHAGDLFVGDLFFNLYFGVAEFQLLEQLGLDAMAVGNHEFDLGPMNLYGILYQAFGDTAGFPLLSANTRLFDSSIVLQQYISPFVVKQVGNMTVGIFGMTTPQTNLISQPAPAFIDTNIMLIAQQMVDTLTALNCDVIICLSHMGVALDVLMATYVSGIHAVIGGHDHFLIETQTAVTNPSGGTTWVVQVGSYYLYLGKLRLTVDSNSVNILDYEVIPIRDPVPPEPTIDGIVNTLIQGIHAVYGPMYSQQVGYVGEYLEEVVLPESLMSYGNRDTPMGNLVADALRAAGGTQIGIEASGSIAQPFYQGPIVAADVYRSVGYGLNADNGLNFRLARFNVRGSELLTGLEFGLADIEIGDDFMIQVSGMSYRYNPHQPAGQRLLEARVGGQPVDTAALYSVTSTEYIVGFLDYLGIQYEDLHIYPDTSEFQVFLWHVLTFDTVRAYAEGRIRADSVTTSVRLVDAGIPNAFELYQNYPNPFNPSTEIRYALPKESAVTLRVFNAIGQEIATLVDGIQATGTVAVRWDGKNSRGQPVGGGLYFYRMEARPTSGGSAFVLVKKMIFLK
jgi:5'-nucleotidase/UDP-sugar diphosphatase